MSHVQCHRSCCLCTALSRDHGPSLPLAVQRCSPCGCPTALCTICCPAHLLMDNNTKPPIAGAIFPSSCRLGPMNACSAYSAAHYSVSGQLFAGSELSLLRTGWVDDQNRDQEMRARILLCRTRGCTPHAENLWPTLQLVVAVGHGFGSLFTVCSAAAAARCGALRTPTGPRAQAVEARDPCPAAACGANGTGVPCQVGWTPRESQADHR